MKTRSVSRIIYFEEKKVTLRDMQRERSAQKIKKCMYIVGSFTISAQGA